MPTWGATNTPFLRLLNAEYSDGNKLKQKFSLGSIDTRIVSNLQQKFTILSIDYKT